MFKSNTYYSNPMSELANLPRMPPSKTTYHKKYTTSPKNINNTLSVLPPVDVNVTETVKPEFVPSDSPWIQVPTGMPPPKTTYPKKYTISPKNAISPKNVNNTLPVLPPVDVNVTETVKPEFVPSDSPGNMDPAMTINQVPISSPKISISGIPPL